MEILQSVIGVIPNPIEIIDAIIVYLIIYRLLVWIAGTQAEKLTRGLVVVFILYLISHLLGLDTLKWLLGKASTALIFIIIIVFQPELRRFLERIGAGQLFSPFMHQSQGQSAAVIKALLTAIERMSKEQVGGLIVIEVSNDLNQYSKSGVKINAEISADLLANLFWPGSPTHDGAVIIRENKIIAAGCLLPLTHSVISDRRLGTRHRAAIGLSEETDALIIVVSEETGVISLVETGNITRYLTKEALETRLFSLYKEDTSKQNFNVVEFVKNLIPKKRKGHLDG